MTTPHRDETLKTHTADHAIANRPPILRFLILFAGLVGAALVLASL